jgi:hypothetical protein
MGSQSDHSPAKDHTWDGTWPVLNGWKRWLTVAQAEHDSFTDLSIAASKAGLSDSGTIAAERGIAITRAYVAAFFDQHLKGRAQPLLDAPTPGNPEVAFHSP